MFSSANILQTKDVVLRVVLSQSLAYFFLVKRVKCSAISVLTSKTTQLPRSSRLTIHLSVNFAARLTSSAQYGKFFQIWSTIADYVNYAWDFSQSETEKYFEWIITHCGMHNWVCKVYFSGNTSIKLRVV